MTKNLETIYPELINSLKNQIKTARLKAHLAVNRELLILYFKIGNSILEKIKNHDWGNKIIPKVSQDLVAEFPNMKGLSTRNIKYMRQFAQLCKNSIGQQLAAQLENLEFLNIPWGHIMVILDQNFQPKQSLWYAQEITKNGWSRNVLIHQIKSDLYKRQATLDKTHNFDLTLPNSQSDLAKDLLKDEYNFEFLRGTDFKEKELENNLTNNITKLLLELGKGFAFIGKQYKIEVGGQDFFIDLLFYNIELRCFVVIELKTGEFKPEYSGKLGFYLSAIDQNLRPC